MSTGYLIPPLVLSQWKSSRAALGTLDTRGPEQVAITLVLALASCLAVALRVRACVLSRCWKISDTLALLALALTLAYYAVFCCGSIDLGLDHHTFSLADDELVGALKTYFVLQLLYIATSCTMKINLGFLLLSIVSTKNRLLRRLLAAFMAFIVAQALVFIACIAFSCQPFDAYWLQVSTPWLETHEFHCLGGRFALSAVVGAQVVLDAILCLIALALLNSAATLVRRPRLPSTINTSIALVVVIVGCFRTYTILRNLHRTYDFVWEVFDLAFWGGVEFACIHLCASWPGMREVYYYIYMPDPAPPNSPALSSSASDADDADARHAAFSEKRALAHDAERALSWYAPSLRSGDGNPFATTVTSTASADMTLGHAFAERALVQPGWFGGRLAGGARPGAFRMEVCAETEITVELEARVPGSAAGSSSGSVSTGSAAVPAGW